MRKKIPLGKNFLFIERKEEEVKTEGGVVVQNLKADVVEGSVEEVGPGVTTLKKGDIVLIPTHAGLQVSPLDATVRMVEEDEALAKVVDEED